jgi:hypothetical protein
MHVQPVFTSHASFLNHTIPRLLLYNILTVTIEMPGKQLVVFDFDWSFVDQDTDRFVLEVLSTKLRRKLQTIKSGGSQCTPDVV